MSTVEAVQPLAEIVQEIKKSGGEAFKYCYRCGKCDVVCPWNRVRKFSIRKIVQQASFGLAEIELEDMWRCTTCGTCPEECPRGVEQIEVGVALRRIASQYGVFPGAAQTVSLVRGRLAVEGNPMGEERGKRDAWTEGLAVPIKPFEEGMDVLFFVGCYYSYDPRMRKVARAIARIFAEAGVDYGILGSQESCCGESIRKTGNEEVFKKLARDNIKTFIDRGVRKIVVASPHCFHTFKNEYSEFMVNFEVVHMSQFLGQLVDAGRLKLTKRVARRVAYHDPCYLGRHNGIYDEPRDLLRKVPGLELVELADHHAKSLCCGGGGGRIWMDTPKGERFADIRLAQTKDARAQALVTACPYCITNFEEARIGLEGDAEQSGGEAGVEIKDLAEIVAEAIWGSEVPA